MSRDRGRLKRWVGALRRRSRWRRGVTGLLVAAALEAFVVSLFFALVLAGAEVPAIDPRWSLVAAAAGALAGVVAGALWPEPRLDLIREADRRLALDGALLTAVQVADDDDAVCRLLVAETVRRVADLSPRRAVPLRLPAPVLLAPALIALAVGLGLRSGPVVVAHREPVALTDPQAERLSEQLQELAAEILRRPSAGEAEALAVAREVLDADRELRTGRLSADEVRDLLQRLVESHRQLAGVLRPVAAGGGEGAGGDAGDAAGSAGIDGSGAPGTGDGAGDGAAPLATTVATAAGRSGQATWTLPTPRSFPDGSGPGEAGDPVSRTELDEPGFDSARLASRRDPLTPSERELVGRYLEALARERTDASAPRGDARRSADDG